MAWLIEISILVFLIWLLGIWAGVGVYLLIWLTAAALGY